MFRKLVILIAALGLTGCDWNKASGDTECSADWQKQFVWDAMNDWYYWNDLLPATIDFGQFAGPEDLLDYLVSFQPLDYYSYIGSAFADAAYYGEGQYEGFGFSSRFEAADDLRLTSVFANSPADLAGFERGHRILELNGRTIADIEANEGVGAVFANPALTFHMSRVDSSEYTVTVSQAVVTIDPLPQWRIIDTAGGPVGYVEFGAFISTADIPFDSIFEALKTANVTDLIIDLRYNGGGLVSTAELFADYLGGFVSDGQVFTKTIYNANHTAENRLTNFQQLVNSLNLSRLIVVASKSTASASELVINGMEPHAEVTIVGDTTYGKPVGQVGLTFCGNILRVTAFETLNSLDVGGYYDGLPVDCPAIDDLSVATGADADPAMVSGLSYLETGACPVPAGALKPRSQQYEKPINAVRSAAWVNSRAL